ncbi:unknown protein [Spodoptera frugiperda multiple nucleopolyhedrovirus]|uniref:Sf108 n=1 Tax=Spodoptera frugiperda nuclear polyhedrosis virus TaxID=10455 RepID=A1YJ98_NPVSF|nr:hypothetical protein SFMNPV_gp108 [Spodoptera frugiperda multiple nucleopolyhedrovirus]ABM45818.1 unknown protein [Spodoptera frugiperda multiple nucleopolyhedrovirus]ACA02665.1 unknown [Spodoptera frugiperda multiple nucleopolyhedrovirus]ADV91340.1 hypothetical protein Sf108 [Spodoptera frugiperda multiple nucleopolyhedrovirus]AFH59050.1 hypothetical protein Sf108 [Spodoptera frugiperda multiple nucleopolyhedrovirus]QED40021.1 hypothetical protein [Spodoptera frugiperda multiple nucleopoly
MSGKSGSKRKPTSSRLSEIVKFKRKQDNKPAVPTTNDLEDDGVGLNFDPISPINSPPYFPNYDPDVSNSAMDVDIRKQVVFVRPPTMNQITKQYDNINDIQNAIDNITQYMDALQNNISSVKWTTKQHFTFFENQVNKIGYKDIMISVLNNNTVNRDNFYALSNMFYNYYVHLFNNIIPLAHIIVNVNYTHNKTRITHSMTAFLNMCAHYVVSNIRQLFNSEPTINIPESYYKIITDKQQCLTNLYNFKLNDLRNLTFIKHTPDNDVNTYTSTTASNPKDRVISFPIYVVYNIPNLKFE